MNVSIVMAYYNRKCILLNTLNHIAFYNTNPEVIIVDDASDESERIDDLQVQGLSIKVIRIEPKDKTWVNPCIPFNIGFANATGDIIIIQNPESYHCGDIVSYCKNNLNANNYFSFACYSLDKDHTQKLFNKQLFEILHNPIATGGNCWYNHSEYRPKGYHFCSAIYKEDLKKIHGFNECFKDGFSYDDDELILRVQRNGIKMRIIDIPYVYHCYHYNEKSYTSIAGTDSFPLVQKNKSLFEQICKSNYSSCIDNKYF